MYKANAIGMAIADILIPSIVTDSSQVSFGVKKKKAFFVFSINFFSSFL
jgi:hypothetical protein